MQTVDVAGRTVSFATRGPPGRVLPRVPGGRLNRHPHDVYSQEARGWLPTAGSHRQPPGTEFAEGRPITAGISGKNLSSPTAKKLIRCLLEYYEGDDYASRVDITQFKVGKPRKWQPYNDIGPGTIDTLVYPIKVTANQIWWNSTTTEERKWLRIFNCYYSTLDEWTCGLGERIKDWPLVTRPRG